MRERSVPTGTEVLVQGQQGIGFFVILSGKAEVSVDGEARRTLGPGDHFGEVAMLKPGAIRTATVTAATDLELACMTSWQFRPLVLEQPHIAWTLLETMANQMA